MAPLRPSKDGSHRVKSSAAKVHTSFPQRQTDSAFTSSKKDKRLMKHSIFMSKVQDSGVKKTKRRRPSKKLVANLDSLEDALQDVATDDVEKSKAPEIRNVRAGRGQSKRREKLVKQERERFGQNMAVLATSVPVGTSDEALSAGAPAKKYAALRAHIMNNSASVPVGTG